MRKGLPLTAGRGASKTTCSKVLPGAEDTPRGLGACPGGTAPLGPSPRSCSTSGLAFPRLGDCLGDLPLSPLIACLSVAKQQGWGVQRVLGVGLSSASPSPGRGHVRLFRGLASTSVRWHSNPFSARCVGPGPWPVGDPMGSRPLPGTGPGKQGAGKLMEPR